MKEAIRSEVELLVSGYPAEHTGETIWRRPLVGFASGADPLFGRLKSAVSATQCR